MTTIKTSPVYKTGDYSQKELDKLMSIPQGKGAATKLVKLAEKWGRKPHNVYLRWREMMIKAGLFVTNKQKSSKASVHKPTMVGKNVPVLHTVPMAIPAPKKGKDIVELVLELGAPEPSRGPRASTIELQEKLKPLLNQMLPLGQGVVHSIPVQTSSKETVRKLLKTPPFNKNKYTIYTVPDNKKMSRIFRYR